MSNKLVVGGRWLVVRCFGKPLSRNIQENEHSSPSCQPSPSRERELTCSFRERGFPKQQLLFLIISALLITAMILPAAAKVITTPHFTVLYSGDNEIDARLVAEEAERVLPRLHRNLGAEMEPGTPRIPIHVYSTRSDFLKKTGTNRKTLVVGRAWSMGAAHKIEIDASGTYARLEALVAHEVTHVVIARMLGPKVNALPLWANEGIARIESGEYSSADDDAVGEAISDGTFIPLSELRTRFPTDMEKASLAYYEGASFVNYITKRNTRTTPTKSAELLRRLSDTDDFGKTVQMTTGVSLERLQKEWRGSISKSYGGGWFARNIVSLAGITMALLCIAAWLAIRRKKRWTAARWIIEEQYASDLDYGEPPE